jgi:hypothetical protein
VDACTVKSGFVLSSGLSYSEMDSAATSPDIQHHPPARGPASGPGAIFARPATLRIPWNSFALTNAQFPDAFDADAAPQREQPPEQHSEHAVMSTSNTARLDIWASLPMHILSLMLEIPRPICRSHVTAAKRQVMGGLGKWRWNIREGTETDGVPRKRPFIRPSG